MAIESMPQLVQHAKNYDDIAERCVGILALWAHYFERSNHYRNISVIDWSLREGETGMDIWANYRAWDRTSCRVRRSIFPAMYLFMPLEDVEADIKKRRRDYDKELRKARKEDARKDQERHDAWIEQEYAKLQERRAKKRRH